MRRLSFGALLTMVALVAGCERAPATPSLVTPEPAVPCVRSDRVDPRAVEVALEFLGSMYSFDVNRMQELAVPRLQGHMVIQAFNGPGAEQVEVVRGPEVVERLQCGDSVRLSLMATVGRRNYEDVHLVLLTLQPHEESWLISDVAGNYSYKQRLDGGR